MCKSCTSNWTANPLPNVCQPLQTSKRESANGIESFQRTFHWRAQTSCRRTGRRQLHLTRICASAAAAAAAANLRVLRARPKARQTCDRPAAAACCARNKCNSTTQRLVRPRLAEADEEEEAPHSLQRKVVRRRRSSSLVLWRCPAASLAAAISQRVRKIENIRRRGLVCTPKRSQFARALQLRRCRSAAATAHLVPAAARTSLFAQRIRRTQAHRSNAHTPEFKFDETFLCAPTPPSCEGSLGVCISTARCSHWPVLSHSSPPTSAPLLLLLRLRF